LSELLQIQAKEVQSLMNGFRPGPGRDSLIEKGVTLGGVKHFVLSADDNEIQAKKGVCGMSIAKADKCELTDVLSTHIN